MTRTMFDSVNPGAIPPSAPMVAVYLNGAYATTEAAVRAHHPDAVIVWIDVDGTRPLDAGVLDVERGDATPEQSAVWARKRAEAGFRATVYCNRATWPAVQTACHGLTVSYWVADWTHVPHELPGAVAVQWTNGTAFDTSLVTDDTWHAAPAPAPRDGYLVESGAAGGFAGRALISHDGGKTWA